MTQGDEGWCWNYANSLAGPHWILGPGEECGFDVGIHETPDEAIESAKACIDDLLNGEMHDIEKAIEQM